MHHSPFTRLAAAVALSVMSLAANAQQNFVMLVVDPQQIIAESKAGKSISQQMDQHRQTFMKEMAQSENSLNQQRDELQRQTAVLSKEAVDQRLRDFQAKVDDLRRNADSKQRTLQYSWSLALNDIERNIVQVVSEIATERKASLVLSKQAAVIVDKNLDITPEVLQRLDQRLPSVAFNLVQPPSPQAAAPASAQKGGAQDKGAQPKAKSSGSTQPKQQPQQKQ
jgi:Skp family chaperone for outer membrane proteins